MTAFDWRTGNPPDHGFDPDRLQSQWQALAERGTKTFLVARGDTLLYERYAEDWSEDKRHYSASLAKALVGGLSLMLALDDGLVGPDDLACDYIPQWRHDPRKARITLRHLASHSSGLENAEVSSADRLRAQQEGRSLTDHHMELPGWKGAFWRQEPDAFTIARDQAPVVFEPGTAYDYSNPGMAMLAYALTAAFKGTPHADLRTLLRQRLFEPIGLTDDDWSIGYGRTDEVDGLPIVPNWGGGSFTARAVARIGLLLLQNGVWQDRHLIGPAAVQTCLRAAGTPRPPHKSADPCPDVGLCFWLNADGGWPQAPRSTFGGAGAGNQILLVVPDQELIIVRNGSVLAPQADGMFWGGVVEHLLDPLMWRPPYPPSPVITGVTWDPPSRIPRLATGGKTRDGSDNWPMTWAADGHLYTAYGDGYGFEPGVDAKLGMGMAVVTGGPRDFRGYNIRSDAENSGYGKNGAKSSGILSVGGRLYLWVRNADGNGLTSRLGYSDDQAKTWTWCDWIFDEFGHPAFINFGRDYAGARDGYVYVVSHDNPSAYAQADGFVLLRVPQDRLLEREAYECVRGFDIETPLWSTDIAQRVPVFAHKGQCRRSSVSYNAGLGRYLWWQQLTFGDSTDTRFSGGFGLFDAPEPWGPWTTVFYTENWDVGPGDLGCFPTKWMSADGRTVFMVFAGNDHFCVRRAKLEG